MNKLPKDPSLSLSEGQFSPIGSQERLKNVDVLRGIALLGIILVNIYSFSGYGWLSDVQKQALPSYTWDPVIDTLLHVMINTKFMTLFSFLFGIGFAIQMQRAQEQSIHFRKYFLRRMGILLSIAILHAYLLWFGDIVRYYAVIGMFLLLVCHWSNRAILRLGIIFAVPLTALAFILVPLLLVSDADFEKDGLPLSEVIVNTFARGNYLEVLSINWYIDPIRNFWRDSPLTLMSATGKILIGFWMGRIALFAKPQLHARMLNLWIAIGISFGLICSIGFWAIEKGYWDLDSLWLLWVPFVVAAGMLMQSLAYVGLVIKAMQSRWGKRILAIFEPVGKTALSNYVFQSFICIFIFYGYMPGFQWFGNSGVTELFFLSLFIFCIEIGLSKLWLRYHSQGPLEWIWRKLAYRN